MNAQGVTKVVFEIFLLVLSMLLFGLNVYLTRFGKTAELVNSVREQALALFLYAEKTGLTNDDKMNLVVDQIVKLVDKSKLSTVVGEQTVRVWLQSLYDGVKRELS